MSHDDCEIAGFLDIFAVSSLPPFEFKERLFPPDAAAVPAEFPVGVHDPVAGDYDRDPVQSV